MGSCFVRDRPDPAVPCCRENFSRGDDTLIQFSAGAESQAGQEMSDQATTGVTALVIAVTEITDLVA
jgi:hypothetical protein